ncbi:MAG TPA: GNAT family N-acetyltransferase [Planctomycetota bacterium]|nr:GNAT family N-acetyltransferase [Planctomycetota bacterium]
MPGKSKIQRAVSAMTLAEAESRIQQLRQRAVPAFSDPENLDKPLDPDIELRTEVPGRTKIVLRVGDADASWATVIAYTQQIGEQTVLMGGIAGVRTHDDHRFKGYSRRVLENTLRHMRQNGFGVSMLYGVPSYYPKFGFAPAFPNVNWWLSLRDAEALPLAPTGLKWTAYESEHLAGVLALYHKQNAGRTGVVQRDPKTWQPWLHGSTWNNQPLAFVALDAAKKVQAYSVYDDAFNAVAVLECACRSPEQYGDLIAHAAQRALNQRVEKIRFELPSDSGLMEFCKVIGSVREETFRRDGSAMVRMIDLPVALVSIGHELGTRMAGRGPGSLAIKTNLDSIGLRWQNGTLEVTAPHETGPVVKLPQWALAQLYFGYHRVETLAAQGVLTGSVESQDLLAALFPQRNHYFHRVDEF